MKDCRHLSSHLEGFIVRSALQVVAQLIVREMRSNGADHVPPSGSANSSGTDVRTDGHVAEKQPTGDETFGSATRWFVHDVQVRGVEAEGSGRQTISYQVDPQELNRDQSFGQAKSSSQKDADDLYDTK